MTHRRTFGLTLACAASIAFAASATAQTREPAPTSTSFPLEHFEPLPAQETNIGNVASSTPLGANQLGFGLTMHFVDDPLQVRTDGEISQRLIDDQLKAELTAAYGLFGIGDVGLALPVVLHQTTNGIADFGGEPARSTTLGDLRFVLRAGILDPADTGGFGVGLAMPVFVPTGDTGSFNGDQSFRLEPRVVGDWTHSSGIRVLANVGYQIRSQQVALSYVSDDILRVGTAVEVPLAPVEGLSATGNLFGHFALSQGRDPAEPSVAAPNANGQPFEAQAGVRYRVMPEVMLHGGAGIGLTTGVGAPDFRVLAGASWSPQLHFDADRDGVKNNVDQCPDEAEDPDGFEDADGCPDFDNDEDLVVDSDDQCPDEYEDRDGFEDDDGCPDPDNDQDGFPDDEDRCPVQAGIQELMGCPEEDNDEDGIADHEEDCPENAEDLDGFEDDDGCPDYDNDGDGLFDGEDTCPDRAEVINENSDTDGCPDDGESKVRVTVSEIETLEPISFASRSRVSWRSRSVLNQVAAAMTNHSRIDLLRIEVHTASRGRPDANMKLSQKWAEAVQAYLVDAGVEESRLVAEGFGDTQPLKPDQPDANENARVEFIIATVAPPPADVREPVDTEETEPEEPVQEEEGFEFGEEEVQ